MSIRRTRQLTRLAKARAEEHRQAAEALTAVLELETARQQQLRAINLANAYRANVSRVEMLATADTME